MQDIYVKLANLKIRLEEKLTHPFLMKYLPMPNIDEDKLLLFYAIFDEMDLSDKLKESYIMTAMLVQIALDTHEEVTSRTDISSTEFVKRQLTVLAGDYYSGLYYFILSREKDFKMVRTLATAIKEINEHKIALYTNHLINTDAGMKSIAIVETALFQKVADHLELQSIKQLSESFVIYKRLSHEKLRLVESNNSDAQKEFSFLSLSFLKNECEEYFNKTASLLELDILKNKAVKNVLYKRLKSIRFHETLHNKKTVEEGLQ